MYTSLFSSEMFDAVKSDVMTGATGWLSVVVALAGAALIIKVLFK